MLIYDRDPRRLKCFGAIAARGVKALQYEAWDHVGVIYRAGGDGEPRVLEMSGKGLGDCPFEETVELCSANSLYLRRLIRPSADQGKLDAWLEEMRKVPYENNMMEMYRAIHDSEEEVEHIRKVKELEKAKEDGEASPRRKQLEVDVEKAEEAAKGTFGANEEGDDSSLFCSELVAGCWQQLGALPAYPPANDYVPRDWMTPGDVNLPLLAHYSLSPPELLIGKKMPKNGYYCGCCRFCG